MNRYQFHPYEIAICGYSNSGKTTLIESLLQEFSNYHVGVIKHDAHHFEMDKKGKDTFRFKESGAKDVLISNQNKYCLQSSSELTSVNISSQFIDNDFVIIEGHKRSKIPKLLIIDENEEVFNDLKNEEITNIKAIIINDEKLKEKYHSFNTNVFFRDDIRSISKFILSNFHTPTKIKALILAGGYGKRMGQDKGSLKYHNKFQTHHLYDLLKESIDDVYISIRPDQKDEEHLKGLPHIYDVYPSKGPMCAILSAFEIDPNCAWLVVAVDQPFLDSETIFELVKKRDPFKVATCFENPEKKWPEPLCTIWEPKSKRKLFDHWSMDRFCPRKILFNSEVNLLQLKNTTALANCNTPCDYKSAVNIINRGIHARS